MHQIFAVYGLRVAPLPFRRQWRIDEKKSNPYRIGFLSVNRCGSTGPMERPILASGGAREGWSPSFISPPQQVVLLPRDTFQGRQETSPATPDAQAMRVRSPSCRP